MEILGPAWDLSTEALFDQALSAIRAQSDDQHTFLVVLQERATQAVFDRATALLVSHDALERQSPPGLWTHSDGRERSQRSNSC